jgi:dihydrofolate reductase
MPGSPLAAWSGRSGGCGPRPADGDIGIGGATLAGEAAQLGLIDEFHLIVCPVLVGGGIPFYPQCERRLDLELIESRTFSSRAVYLRYRLARY